MNGSSGSLAVKASSCTGTVRASYDLNQPRRICASAIRETTMDKVNEVFFYSFPGPSCPDQAAGKAVSSADSNTNKLYIEDQRVAQLLVLLEQLDESAGGLAELPAPELSEVVLSAVRLCGFVDELEARDVLATVLEAIEMLDGIPEASWLQSESGSGN